MKKLGRNISIAAACVIALATGTAMASGKTLQPFADEAEFARLLAKWNAADAQRAPRLVEAPPAPIAMAPESESTSLDSIVVTGSRITAQDLTSITNVQTSGVDEGDIVKRSGDHLVVLRRGRLFTVRIGADQLQPIASINAWAPGADPDNTWYDEMLVSDGTVVVIGYSYDRGGTEIGLFDLDQNGRLGYRATYQMRSNDYYSARNYASRLLGRKLIFYTPLEVDTYASAPDEFLPALRHWHLGATPADFKRILPATRIYRNGADLDPDETIALHTVSICDLDAPTLQCQSTAVLGGEGRAFYVSEDAVYVWNAPWNPDEDKPNASAVFRIPLDGTAPTGLRTSGSPIDQMSFLQRDGYLNVLVGSEADGEGMWSSRSRAGELALLRIPLDRLGDGTQAARASDYRVLPVAEGADVYDLSNRYVGDWLLYGEGNDWGRRSAPRRVHSVRFASADPAVVTHLTHPIERIDALGSDAIVVGTTGPDLQFTSLHLDQTAAAVSVYVQPNATQGDERTHGFFYRPTNDDEGVVGLPVLGFDPNGDGATASVLFLRNQALRLGRMGALDSRPSFDSNDGCQVSCVDWYGNARPIFIGTRVFALLGYELVEGRIDGDRIVERRRADFGPEKPH